MDISDSKSQISTEFKNRITFLPKIRNDTVISLQLASKLCGISTNEIVTLVACSMFPKPVRFSRRGLRKNMAFYLKDLHEWIKDPAGYRSE